MIREYLLDYGKCKNSANTNAVCISLSARATWTGTFAPGFNNVYGDDRVRK